MPDIWTFHSAGAVIFGPGAIARLGEQANRHRWARVLVVTDRTLVGAGLLDEVRTPLKAAGVEVGVFEDGEPEPSIAAVMGEARYLGVIAATSWAALVTGLGLVTVFARPAGRARERAAKGTSTP